MPQFVSNDIVLFTIRYLQQGQILMNTGHFRYLDSFAGVDDTDAYLFAWLNQVGDVDGWLGLTKDYLSTDIAITSIQGQVIWPNRYTPVPKAITFSGTQPGAAAPINSAMTITKKSAFATRWGQGSWHQPGWPMTAVQNAGNFNDDDVLGFTDTLAQLFLTKWKPPGMNGTLEGIIWSRSNPGRTPSIVKVRGNKTIRTERRRTVGVGK